MTTNLGTSYGTANLYDGCPPNSITLYPIANYTNYIAWQFTNGTATKGNDYSAIDAPNYVQVNSPTSPLINISTHLHPELNFYLNVYYYLVDPSSGATYTETLVITFDIAADNIGEPTVSPHAFNMPASLDLIASQTTPNEYDSSGKVVDHYDGTWSDPTAPAGYASGTNTTQLSDEWGVDITRTWGSALDKYIDKYGTEDVKDVKEIVSKLFSSDLDALQVAIHDSPNTSLDQLESETSQNLLNFGTDVENFLARKFGVPGAVAAKKVVDKLDSIVTGIHDVENYFLPNSPNSVVHLAQTQSTPVFKDLEFLQTFTPGAPVYVNLNDWGQAAIDYINAGHQGANIVLHGNHNILKILGSNYSVQFQRPFSNYLISDDPNANGGSPLTVTDPTPPGTVVTSTTAAVTGDTSGISDGQTDMVGVRYLRFTDLTLDMNNVFVHTVHTNDLSHAGTAHGANHFIDYLNFVASYTNLVYALGTNVAAAQNWYQAHEPILHLPDTFDGLDYVASYRNLINAFKGAGSLKAVQDHGAAQYINHGIFQGLTTTFNGLDYIASYGDLISAYGANSDAGAYQYIKHGMTQGRTTTFDGLNYIASYADLITSLGANEQAGAFNFIKHGFFEGRTTTFDSLAYLAANPDLMLAFGSNGDAAATQYITQGYYQGRTTTFNIASYETAHPDLVGKYASNDAFLKGYIDHYYLTHSFLI